jgi:hypothetical protein
MISQGYKNTRPGDRPSQQNHANTIPADTNGTGTDAADSRSQANSSASTRNTSFKWLAWVGDSNWWLVIIGALTGGAIVWQAAETRRAATGTLKAAEATRQSVEALIGKERARIFMSATITKNLDVRFSAENRGESPAYFTSGFVNCASGELSEELPITPDYTFDAGEWMFSVESWSPWLAAKDKRAIGGWDAAMIEDSKGQEFLDQILGGQRRLWFYGIVRYRDNVSPIIHETKFCMACILVERGEHSIYERGPEEYCRQT